MKKVICSQKAPGAIGPYSQAIEANGMIFVSGQLPIDATTGQMAEGALIFLNGISDSIFFLPMIEIPLLVNIHSSPSLS